MPFFSILMAVYNGEDVVEDCINSILTQTFTDWELIIVNDGSIDRTKEILEGFRDPRIRILTQDNNGLTKSLIKAYRFSKGKWIVRQDADDLSLRNRLHILNQEISNSKEIDFFHSQSLLIDAKKIKIYPNSRYRYDTSFASLIFGNYIVHGSIAVRRQVMDNICYDENVAVAQDYEWYCRIKEAGIKPKMITIPLYVLRRTSSSITSTRSHEQSKVVKRACLQTFHTTSYFIEPDCSWHRQLLLVLLRKAFLFYLSVVLILKKKD